MTCGEKGRIGVAYTGVLPWQFRGPVTNRLYVWRDAIPVWIDKRDLPGLVKMAGRDKLEGEIDASKQKTKQKAKPKPKKVTLGKATYGEKPIETESIESTESEEV